MILPHFLFFLLIYNQPQNDTYIIHMKQGVYLLPQKVAINILSFVQYHVNVQYGTQIHVDSVFILFFPSIYNLR